MKRAATIGLAMTLITLNACIFSSPAMAEGLLSDLVKDTVGTAAHVVGGVVGGAAGITSGIVSGATGLTTGAISGADDIVTGTVDATGAVLDTSGHVVGRVLIAPNSSTTTIGWTTVTPATATTLIPGTTVSSDRIYTFGSSSTVYGATFDTRISDLRSALNVAESSGRLSPSQAADMRERLDRIAHAYSSARGTTDFTFNGALLVAHDLDAFNVVLANSLSVRPFAPLIVSRNGTDRLLVTSAVIPGINSTSLSGPGAVSMIGGTSNVIAGTTNVIAGTGSIDGGTFSAAGISNSPTALLPILDQRRLEFDRLIASASANHAISAAEAARLQADLGDIANRMVVANGAGPTYSVDAVTTLARSLDDFNNRLARSINAPPLAPLTVIGNNSLPVLSPTVFNNVIGLPAVQPNIWFSTLTDRRAALEAMIASGTSAGTISAAQAAELRAQLARIAATIDATRASGAITYTTALPLAMNLDVIGNQIHTYSSNVAFVPLISQGRISFAGGLSSPIDECSLRRAELGAAIDREKASGRLSQNEAQRLQFELGNIGHREGRFLSDGILTYRELVQITNDLNRFQSRLNTLIANRRATVSLR